MTDVRFEVLEKRKSKYSIEAIPWNEQASYIKNNLAQEITLKGQTVKDMYKTGLYAIPTEMNEQQQILKAHQKDNISR